MKDVNSISLGSTHTGAVKKDGSLWLWGDNSKGQLGNGARKKSKKPIKIMENVKSVCLGEYNSVAIKKDGTLWMWGSNWNGELGMD